MEMHASYTLLELSKDYKMRRENATILEVC